MKNYYNIKMKQPKNVGLHGNIIQTSTPLLVVLLFLFEAFTWCCLLSISQRSGNIFTSIVRRQYNNDLEQHKRRTNRCQILPQKKTSCDKPSLLQFVVAFTMTDYIVVQLSQNPKHHVHSRESYLRFLFQRMPFCIQFSFVYCLF